MKIRKGDTVEIINGKSEEKGKRGEVLRVIPDRSRIVVQGVNIRKKHKSQVETKGRRSLSPGIIEFEAPLSISNVMLVCPECNEPSRIGFLRSGKTVMRFCKKCNSEFE